MFCTNCGKRIIDTARFCNYCGTKIVEIDGNKGAVSDNITENPAPLTSENEINTENVENLGNLLKMTDSVSSSIPKMNESPKSGYSPDSVPITPDSALSAAPSASVAALSPKTEAAVEPYAASLETGTPAANPYATTTGLPETGTAPAYPGSALSPAAAPDGALSAASAAGGLPKEETPRKYTLGHLMMCLAASGVMAIAAGIFAGLYFSVV